MITFSNFTQTITEICFPYDFSNEHVIQFSYLCRTSSFFYFQLIFIHAFICFFIDLCIYFLCIHLF